MNNYDLIHAVALKTGDDACEIRRLGFTLAAPLRRETPSIRPPDPAKADAGSSAGRGFRVLETGTADD